MKPILAACLLAVSLAAHAATETVDPKPPDDQQTLDDQKALQGDWVPIKAELAGQPVPETVLKTISLKLIKNEYEALVAGQPDKGTWTIDAAAKPKRMKITGVKGPNADKTFPCIYELTDNTLRVCYDLSGKKTPEDFKTTAGTKLYLVTYKRKKE
jgi:uncharacterized protein (TIGR03067 family)